MGIVNSRFWPVNAVGTGSLKLWSVAFNQKIFAQQGDPDKVRRSPDKRHRAFPLDQDGTSVLGPDLMFASFRVQHDIPGEIPPMVIALAARQDDDHL